MNTPDKDKYERSLSARLRETSTPPRKSAPPAKSERSAPRIGLGVIIFVATLLGSLLGVAADFGDAAATVEQVRDLFNPELCIVGSNTILGEGITMAADWAEEFEAQHDARVTIRGIGSVRGVEEAARGGCVHVLAMSEPMTDAQYTSLLNAGVSIQCAAVIGYDVIAVVTDINNDLAALLSRQLGSILTGQIRNWSEVGGDDRSIRILARPGSGTTEVVLINVARYSDPDITDDQYFPPNTNYTACESNEQCLDMTLSTPGSLYWVSTAWMRTQPTEYIRVMPILRGDERPVNPLTDEVDLEEYPSALIRPLYLYALGSSSIDANVQALASDFLAYVRSVRGQQVLERYHFYTFFSQPTEVRVTLPSGFEADSDGARPVCLPNT